MTVSENTGARPLILASASPRRHELLTAAGLPHTVLTSEADDTLPAGISPAGAVEMLSARNAAAVFCQGAQELFIGAKVRPY